MEFNASWLRYVCCILHKFDVLPKIYHKMFERTHLGMKYISWLPKPYYPGISNFETDDFWAGWPLCYFSFSNVRSQSTTSWCQLQIQVWCQQSTWGFSLCWSWDFTITEHTRPLGPQNTLFIADYKTKHTEPLWPQNTLELIICYMRNSLWGTLLYYSIALSENLINTSEQLSYQSLL